MHVFSDNTLSPTRFFSLGLYVHIVEMSALGNRSVRHISVGSILHRNASVHGNIVSHCCLLSKTSNVIERRPSFVVTMLSSIARVQERAWAAWSKRRLSSECVRCCTRRSSFGTCYDVYNNCKYAFRKHRNSPFWNEHGRISPCLTRLPCNPMLRDVWPSCLKGAV